MKHLFVPYELAKQLKEKGFNETCMAYITKDNMRGEEVNLFENKATLRNSEISITTAPLYQQVVDWFREKHHLSVSVDIDGVCGNTDTFFYSFKINEHWREGIEKDHFDYRFGFKHIINEHRIPSYYEALTKAIEEALKLINN